jgi:hypothetical protein
MEYYVISQGGEPVALVADIDMARAITRCQPWGEYLVEPIDLDEAASARPATAVGRSLDRRPTPMRRRPHEQPPRWTNGISADAIHRARHHAR